MEWKQCECMFHECTRMTEYYQSLCYVCRGTRKITTKGGILCIKEDEVEKMCSKERPMKQCDCVCECKRMVKDDQRFCDICKGLQKTSIKERFKRLLRRFL